MKSKPNLFNYATSELSQDAFLTWYIQWADNDYKELDNPLNSSAKIFVKALLRKDSNYEIKTIEAGRQWKNIDVWALINGRYFLVIEDKKGTKEHSDQLKRYSEIAKKHYENSNIEIKLVYFKMEEQGQYKEIKNAGFYVFNRTKMLSILKQYVTSTDNIKQNNIIIDYYKNLNNLDIEISSYLTRPLSEWNTWYGWQGFYSGLQKHIGGDWNYVANRSGGFLGFWWHHKFSDSNGIKFHYYLQLEQEKLVFKLIVRNKDKRTEVRDFYRRFLYKKANELNIEISQFGRLGQHMGVARLDSEYRVTNKNNLLDFQKTIINLKRIMELINETEREITAHNNSYRQ